MARVLPPIPSDDPTAFCRLCFSGSNIHWVVRTRGTAVDVPFVRTIGECLGLWLQMDEDFPCAVCRECTERLDLLIQFRDLCRLCDEALREKRSSSSVEVSAEGVLAFYNTPIDRVWLNGSVKPEYYENDSDFENEPALQESFVDVPEPTSREKQFRLTKAEKKAALDSYLETYNAWYASFSKTVEDDEETMISPEAIQQLNKPRHRSSGKPVERRPPPPPRFKCSQCGKICVSPSALKQHMTSHRRKMLVSCKKCGIQFGARAKFVAHTKKSSACSKAKPVYRCQYCDHTFARRDRCDYHVKTLHPDKELPAGSQLKKTKVAAMNLPENNFRFSSKPGFKNDLRFSSTAGSKPKIDRNGHFAVVLQPLSEELLRKTMANDDALPTKSPVRSYTCPDCWASFSLMCRFSDHLGNCPARQRAASPPVILGE